MVIPRDARPTGKTVHFKYVGAIFVFICLIVAVGYTPSVSAAAPLGNTLGGLANKTVPAVVNTVTGTTAPVTNAVSPALTKTINDVAAPVATTIAPAAVNTVENVATPVVNTAGAIAGPAVPALVNTVDTVTAPVTTTVAPAAVNTVGTVATPLTTAVGNTVAPVTGPVGSVVDPVAAAADNVIAPITRTAAPLIASPLQTFIPSVASLPGAPFYHGSSSASSALQSDISLQQAIYSSLANFLGGISGFFSGILPPSSWLLDNADTSRIIALGTMMLVLFLGLILLFASGGIYRKLRRAQQHMYHVTNETALDLAIEPATAKASAIATTVVVAGIAVMCAVVAGL